MFEFLIRGFLMDEFGGGEGGGTAVLDAPEDTGADTSREVPVEVEHSGGEDSAETGADTNAGTPKPEPTVSEDGKQLSKKAHETLSEIAKTNPQLAKDLRYALLRDSTFRREFPGGIDEARQLRSTIEELGGDDGIRSVREELSGWQQFDQQFTAGDPRAIDFMVETPEGKDAFLRLAPIAFGKFAELNPEGYSAYLAQAFVSTLDSHRIPLALERLQDFIGDNPNAQRVFKQIVDFVNTLGEYASKPVNTPKAATAAPGEDPRFKELESRESNLARSEWRRETAVEQNRVYATELNRILAGRKVNDVQREDILHRVQTKLGLRIKEHAAKLDQYFAVRDKEGFLKFCNAFSKREIPALLQEAVDRYVPAKPGPKAQAAAAGTRAVAAAKPPTGFTFVSKMPGSADIDWASPFTSIKTGRAALKSGQKVTWKR